MRYVLACLLALTACDADMQSPPAISIRINSPSGSDAQNCQSPDSNTAPEWTDPNPPLNDIEAIVNTTENEEKFYYLSGGVRWTFVAQAKVSWFQTYVPVTTLSEEELDAYPHVGNILHRPGAFLLRKPGTEEIYSVEIGRRLHFTCMESVPQPCLDMYGEGWDNRVIDVTVEVFYQYKDIAPYGYGGYPLYWMPIGSYFRDVMDLYYIDVNYTGDGLVKRLVDKSIVTALSLNAMSTPPFPEEIYLPVGKPLVEADLEWLMDLIQAPQ